MPQIQDPELSERLRRKFSIVGSSSIDTIAPELVGVVIVDDVMPNPDRDEGMVAQDITGDTNDIPEVGIRNIDVLRSCVIDRITASTTNTGVEMHLRLGPPGGTELAAAIGQVTDFRRGSLLSAVHTASATDLNSVGGSGTRIWEATVLPNEIHNIEPNIVLAPAGTIVGVNVERDVIHMDIAKTSGRLRVTWFYHFIPPPLFRIV